MFFITMDKNTIFAKLFRLTPFSHDIPAFVDFMAEYGHTITPSQVNCWQRKKGNNKSRPVPDFVFEVMFDYFYKRKEEIEDVFLTKK
ncbi:Uncharacterised protein [[Pasteurella] mairii]|uniref:Uncharacterized protein n=1 Tax=[Pasteurella] mairii TaxID=757 RepID=A0A379B543_9PAST|nr:Uncharacterised protein [[Pasteurella] mairii]